MMVLCFTIQQGFKKFENRVRGGCSPLFLKNENSSKRVDSPVGVILPDEGGGAVSSGGDGVAEGVELR